MRRSALAVLAAVSLVIASAGMALAKGPSGSGNGNSTTWITGAFSTDCTDFDADAGKDISHVELTYAGGTVTKDEHPSTPYSIDGDDPISTAVVKAGTSSKTFPCTPPAATECSDQVDNADPEDANAPLADAADPGCHTDGDPNDGDDTYDPTDDDETDPTTTPTTECSDDVDNADGDPLVDENDPGCHTDGDAGNPGSYDPNDDDETDEGRFTCRASALRISGNPVLEALLGDAGSPFEPRTANAANDPCETDAASSLDQTFAGAPGSIRVTVQPVATDATSGGSANAGTSRLVISSPTATIADIQVTSTAVTATCSAGVPTLDGSAIVVSGTINGETFSSPPVGPITIPQIGVLHIDWQETSTEGGETALVRRAIYLDAGPPVGDVVIAESRAGYVGNPCD